MIDFESMERRVGTPHLRRRLIRQTTHVARIFGGGLVNFHVENLMWSFCLLKWLLRVTGAYQRGHRHALSPVIRNNAVRLPGLPAAFEGFRLLHLSDLHADIDPQFIPAVIQQVSTIECDMCVMTGDYRMLTSGPYDAAMDGMRRLRAAIAAPVHAVLGNHDFIEMTADLEEMGVRMLINESVAIERAGERIWIAGVDDAHFYEADDIDRASQGVPKGACSILLSHSPEVYKHAAACGFALMLCGHTHGGQICLPGGGMILKNSHCPRRFCCGAWRHESMAGYTSRGTGTSGIPVRFNSPAEIVVHQLTRV